jgi:hypothetical protein
VVCSTRPGERRARRDAAGLRTTIGVQSVQSKAHDATLVVQARCKLVQDRAAHAADSEGMAAQLGSNVPNVGVGSWVIGVGGKWGVAWVSPGAG